MRISATASTFKRKAQCFVRASSLILMMGDIWKQIRKLLLPWSLLWYILIISPWHSWILTWFLLCLFHSMTLEHIPSDPSYHQTKGKRRNLKLSGSCKSGGYDEKCLQHFHVYRIRNTDWHWHSCNWKNARCLCKLLAHLLNLTRDENRWQQVHAIVSATLYKDVGCGLCSMRFHEHLYGRQFHSAHLNVYIPWKSTHTLQFQ